MTDWEVQYWVQDEEVKDISYSDYWTDEENEKLKPFYVLDDNFSKAEEYLKSTGLARDFKNCLKVLKNNFGKNLEGVGMDLAAGNLWAVPLILDSGNIDKLYCLEFSRHRLLKIGPRFLEHYNVPKDKVVLVHGNFYELRLPDHSLDFLILVQAFHHSHQPEKLLAEMKRVLKRDGIILIIGEHAVYLWKGYLKYALKYLAGKLFPKNIQRRIFPEIGDVNKFFLARDEIYPPEPVLGDHYYTLGEYQALFKKLDFEIFHMKKLRSQFRSFVLKGN